MDQGNRNQDIAQQTEQATRSQKDLNRELKQSSQLGAEFSSVMINAFQGIAIKGKSLGSVFRTLTLSLSRMALKAAFKPLQQAAGSFFKGLFSGGAGFAKGGVFQQSMPVPFAKGGIISSPVAFPLGRGGSGVAGEAGAEAIMPLARGPDGRLGVRAQAGRNVQVTFNVTTPDAASFRRSETQVAAMLARVVGQGQRNL